MERNSCCGISWEATTNDVQLEGGARGAKSIQTVDDAAKRSARDISRKESVVVKSIAQTLKVGVFTWNVGNAMPEHELGDFCEEGAPDYDILAFGAQECEYNEKVSWGKRPIAKEPKYINNQSPSSGWHHWFGVLQSWLGDEWAPVDSVQLLQMRLIVFVRKHLDSGITNVSTATEATGALHILGNKGGLIIRFLLEETSFAFVSCHLAAHEGPKYGAARSDNIEEVLDGGARIGEISQLDIMTQTDHTFWMGDLNYRIDPFTNGLVEPPAGKKGQEMWPKSGSEAHEAIGKKIRELIDTKQLKELAKHDELSQAIKDEQCLALFQEGDISGFMPTFKVVPVRKYEKDAPGKDPLTEPLQYTWQRWPAWCDRVLWMSRPHAANSVSLQKYTSLPGVMTSDHKPVCAVFDVDMFPAVDPLPTDQPSDAPDLWLSNMKATGLKALDLTGASDPYLFFWCPEIGITNETQGGWSEGTTTAKTQTLNPEWVDEEIPMLKAMTADKSLIREASLVISFLDHDNLDQDDDMGCCTLQLKGFVKEGGNDFKLPVYCNGVRFGELSGHLHVSWPDPVTGKRKTRRKFKGLCGSMLACFG